MMLVADKEKDLVRAAQAGDRKAFEQLARKLYKPVCALAGRMLGRHDEAAEIAQETFTRATKHIAKFDPERKFSAWIFTIAANLCRDRHRRGRRMRALGPEEEATVSIDLPPESGAIRMENRNRVNREVERLSFDLKVVVVMHYQQDLGFGDIAEALGISRNAVRIRLFRALAALRKAVKE